MMQSQLLRLDMATHAALRERGEIPMPSLHILIGDVRDTLRTIPDNSVQCVVTSPPYYGLRNYGVEGQIGLEKSPAEYIAEMVSVMREVRRVLRDNGTFWLNIGDCYASPVKGGGGGVGKSTLTTTNQEASQRRQRMPPRRFDMGDLTPKDRVMIPARVALALQSDGWVLRDEIVWHKPRPMPHPVKDRTVSAHEMVYLLTKDDRYFFDWAAIEEPAVTAGRVVKNVRSAAGIEEGDETKYAGREVTVRETRRARSVWSISSSPYREAHSATMPPALAERCLLAGSAPGDWVLDPFGGAGTTALVAQRLGRSTILCELNPEYAALARKRVSA